MIEDSKVRTFEDLQVWQKARKLNKEIYQLTISTNGQKDFSFIDQLRRASISVSSNIAEGYERQSNKEFVRFLYIARGSSGEIRSLLFTAKDLNYIDEFNFNLLLTNVLEISKMLYGLIKYLEKKT